MPKITAARIALTALIVLTLTGCAGTVSSDASEPQDAAQAAPSETTAPLTAQKSSEQTDADAEAAYLSTVRERLSRIVSQIPDATDEQLLAAGYDACDRLADGESSEGMSVIQDEQKSKHGYYSDSGHIITSATLTLCPPTE